MPMGPVPQMPSRPSTGEAVPTQAPQIAASLGKAGYDKQAIVIPALAGAGIGAYGKPEDRMSGALHGGLVGGGAGLGMQAGGTLGALLGMNSVSGFPDPGMFGHNLDKIRQRAIIGGLLGTGLGGLAGGFGTNTIINKLKKKDNDEERPSSRRR